MISSIIIIRLELRGLILAPDTTLALLPGPAMLLPGQAMRLPGPAMLLPSPALRLPGHATLLLALQCCCQAIQ